MAEIVAYSSAGVDPREMGIGPVQSARMLLISNNLSLDSIDLIEINEPFAAQVLAVERELNWNTQIQNIRGCRFCSK